MSVPSRNIPAPHFRLHSEAAALAHAGDEPSGRWRFVLRSADGRTCLEAEDDEPEGSAERLELLAIVRGLESLDEPARVTLVSAGRSISRGIRYGVAQWRENDWQWERYGKLTPVKNCDLWRRIDRAMAIHDVVCRDLPAASDDLADRSPGHLLGGSAPREEFISRSRPAERVPRPTVSGRRLRFDQAPRRAAFQSPPRPLIQFLTKSVAALARLLRPIFRSHLVFDQPT
ncbi:MAG: hypothetical protein L0211_18125 [Planctomycetaceae bacterium]|nr:hypothetical protein [Planctomycetaceae bacterium]